MSAPEFPSKPNHPEQPGLGPITDRDRALNNSFRDFKIKKTIVEVNDRINAQDGRINGLDSRTTVNEGEIDELFDEVDGLRGKIAAVAQGTPSKTRESGLFPNAQINRKRAGNILVATTVTFVAALTYNTGDRPDNSRDRAALGNLPGLKRFHAHSSETSQINKPLSKSSAEAISNKVGSKALKAPEKEIAANTPTLQPVKQESETAKPKHIAKPAPKKHVFSGGIKYGQEIKKPIHRKKHAVRPELAGGMMYSAAAASSTSAGGATPK